MQPGVAPSQNPALGKRGIPTWFLVLLVMLGAFFILGGPIAVLAIYGVRKYIAAAKQAEARTSLIQIAKDAALAYQADGPPSQPSQRGLCASASRSVPSTAAAVRGTKYQSSPNDWEVDVRRNAGFACLGFRLEGPQYYMYSYGARGRAATGDSFRAMANGDLNGDGVLSTFALSGRVLPEGVVAIDPAIAEAEPGE
jgi:type IV pilus assembly protein PilA